jgi:hypothetical protein
LNNNIDEGEASYTYVIGIIIFNSNIEGNNICGDVVSLTFGISSEDSAVEIQNNTIDDGSNNH